MVEPLLHFAAPFVTLKALGLDWKSALFASLIALTPDLDVLFSVHRSFSHSAIVLLAIVIPILILTRKNATIRNITLLAAFGIATHLILDLFQTGTPLLWPLYNRSIEINTSIDLHIGSPSNIIPSVAVETKPTNFASFQTFDAPLITAEGTGIALVLLAPILFQVVSHQKRANRKASTKRRRIGR